MGPSPRWMRKARDRGRRISAREGQTGVVRPGPDQAEGPSVFGLPGDAADEGPALPRLGEREHVASERPVPREALRLALRVDRPGEGPGLADLQSDGRVLRRA